MTPIEIEEQLSKLANEPFDALEFPFQFLESFGNKKTTIKALRKGTTNKSDAGGVLQRSNVHIQIVPKGGVDDGLNALRESKATKKNKVKFIVVTDGDMLVAENLTTGEPLVCDYEQLGDHFVFFLPLAGIYFTAEIKNQEIDIKATARLNKLYMELLKENPEWGTKERRHDLNQFMARLIFCFFAEDTDIFHGDNAFTNTIKTMSDSRSGNIQEVISELFHVMDIPATTEARKDMPHWKDKFPHVNGGLFGGNREVPRFTRIARSYLIAAGELNWSKINPDIFGSMIQAVADEDERGSLGMHYTSVPNILKVLKPLFLDDLRAKLSDAGDNKRKLLNLRRRIANIRVFDPACGSGNFLVIAYKELREIEAKILYRRGDENCNTAISLENFYGIEIKDFAGQIAQIALLIAEFQCDVLYIDQVQACKNMLPLDKANNIKIGNALQEDWLEVCPPTSPIDIVLDTKEDLFSTPLEQIEINVDEENLGGETYICGNPPYIGSSKQTKKQKDDLKNVVGSIKKWRSLDYVSGWVLKATDYISVNNCVASFVTTNSIFQGEQVEPLWAAVFSKKVELIFAYQSFKWANLASDKAGVAVNVVGIALEGTKRTKVIFEDETVRIVEGISPYITPGRSIMVSRRGTPISNLPEMLRGNMPTDGGHLLMKKSEVENILLGYPEAEIFLKEYWGATELISGACRYCIWIKDDELDKAMCISPIAKRVQLAIKSRQESTARTTRDKAHLAYKFMQIEGVAKNHAIVLPAVTSESREWLTAAVFNSEAILSNRNYAIYDSDLWPFSILCSKLKYVWVGTVCARLESRFAYSSGVGWNSFPVPNLTNENKADLTKGAEDILLAREAHFPKTIANLYKPADMPDDLRAAHERNDETLERIYIGRRFKTDTERLETLFDLYTKMTAKPKKKVSRA